MTVRLSADGTILLEGACPIEDADRLQQLLIADPARAVDWRSCTAAHAAVLQVLLAARPTLLGSPDNVFLRTFLGPALKARV